MRVLHVISGLDPLSGGPTTALIGLAAAQVDGGLNAVVAATYQPGTQTSAVEQLRDHGVTVHLIGPASGRLSQHPGIRPTLHREVHASQVVHIHALWEQIQHDAAVSARTEGVPFLIRPCGMLDPWSLGQNRWTKRMYLWWRLRSHLREATAIHYTSEVERELSQPVTRNPLAIVEPNGIDLREFQDPPARGRFRSRFPQLGQKRIVLFLSRIHHKKGLDLLVPAFARLATEDAVLAIAGADADGYRRTVQQLIASHGIEERVVFCGMLHGTERIEAFVDAEIMVLPSYQENFGIAVVEALASGTPVIISDQVNIHREITHARVGAAIPTQVNPLVAELDRWLQDADLRDSASRRARPFVWEHYDWSKIAARWEQHYRNLAPPRPA